jgi:molybdate transport system ATP-binding protein
MATSGGALDVEIDQRRPMPLVGRFGCAAGELVALVGPSGAGKTSLLRVLAGLIRPQQGRVQVGSEIWFDSAAGIFLSPRERHVGLVFQNYALMPHLSARDNVALSLLHLPRGERARRAQDWLDHVQLSPQEQSRRPSGLSGGQQQRVAVARALARQPRLLLLDEPFSAVDLMNRQGLYQLLADLRRDLSIPIVLVTHDLNEASQLADRLVVMDAGQLLQEGPPAALHRAPRNARVAELMGIHNRFQGCWLGPATRPGWGLLRWTGGTIAAAQAPVLEVRDKGRIAAGQAVSWVLPGEGLTLSPAGEVSEGGYAATVTQARHLGELTLATVTPDAMPGVGLRLTLTGAQRLQLETGRRIDVQLDTTLIHVMPVRNRPSSSSSTMVRREPGAG